MGAANFYHLTESPVAATLPALIGRSLAQGWRVAIRGRDAGRLREIDDALWQAEGFLAHAIADGGAGDARQPVLLTTGAGTANGAACLMSVDSAEVTAEEVGALSRVCILFDGHDDAGVEAARAQWRRLTAAGCTAAYWAQDGGRWTKRAESG